MSLRGREQPRVFTPPLRELTPDTTLGYDVIDFATDVLGIDLFPWQRWLFIHALEVVGDLGGEWHLRFRVVLVLIARQSGKTTMGKVLALFFLYVLGVALILGTAQDLEQAEDTWEAVVEMAQADDELAEEIEHVWYTNGAKRLQLTSGRQYRVKASTRKAGRGKSADLILLDELREHRTWDAWSALSKTGMAREDCVVWCMSNAGDGTSVVLRHLRMQAHRALGDPDGICAELGAADWVPDGEEADDSALAIFEWSAPPGASKWDREAWAQANPSLGYCVSERALRSACQTDPDEVFLTECLCQWVTATVEPPFPEGAWEAGTDDASEIAPNSQLWLGVDVAADRSMSSIAVCGMRADGSWHGELIAYERGTRWLIDWFRRNVNDVYHGSVRVAMQGSGAPASAYVDLIAGIDGVEVTECSGRDLGAWCGRLWDAVAALAPDEGERGDATPIRHRTQPRLDLAANVSATRPVGDGAWCWDRARSNEDASPIVALTMAFGLATEPEEERPRRSAYEESDLVIL